MSDVEKSNPASDSPDENGDKIEKGMIGKISKARFEFMQNLATNKDIPSFVIKRSKNAVFNSVVFGRETGLPNEEIDDGLKANQEQLEGPRDYLKMLRAREFVIENKIFEAFASAVDPNSPGLQAGGYLSHNHLKYGSKRKNFKKKLKNLELSEEAIDFYENLLS